MKAIQQSDSDYLESFSRLTNFFPRPHSLCLKWSNAEKSINRTKLENVDRLKPLFLSASDDNMVYDSPSLVSNLPSSSQPRLNPNFFFFFQPWIYFDRNRKVLVEMVLLSLLATIILIIAPFIFTHESGYIFHKKEPFILLLLLYITWTTEFSLFGISVPFNPFFYFFHVFILFQLITKKQNAY